MMKSEYDRNYQWLRDDNKEDFYIKKRNRENQSAEPRMTHKRRVKLTEDNVIIGEPLLHQSMYDDKKENIVWPKSKKQKDNKKILEKYKSEKEEKIRKESEKQKKIRLINEYVQTEDEIEEKNAHMSNKNPKISNEKREERNKRKKKQTYDNGNQWKNVPLENEKENYNNYQNPSKKNDEEDKKYFLEKKKTEINTIVPAKSEYQIKYAWRAPIYNNEEKNVENSQLKSSLDTKLKIYNNFMSEYQRQYRPYEYVTENRYKKMKPSTQGVDNGNLKFVPEQRRALTPPPPHRHNHVSIDNDKKKKSLQKSAERTMNPQRASFPHGKQKRFLTEYSANYDNKWDRLDAEMHQSIEEKAREANSQAKWFQEILELRKKAQEYRQRSRGTHLSREHLGQVYTKKDDRREPKKRFSDCKENRDSDRNFQSDSVIENCSSDSSSVSSIIIGRSRCQSPALKARTAGKPTNDDNLLLDEEASHDTNVKSVDRLRSSSTTVSPQQSLHRNPANVQKNRQWPSVKDERQYTLEKYLNIKEPENIKQMKTIDYDSVSKNSSNGRVSTRSMISSSTMSLAIETLERAKKNRDDLLRQKS